MPTHPEARSPLLPDVGVQATFRKKKPPQTWRYDSSLSPALEWDGQNPAREVGEWLLSLIEKAAARGPRCRSGPGSASRCAACATRSSNSGA